MHVVMRILPKEYIHTHHCLDGVAVHKHSAFRAMIPRKHLRQIKREIRSRHGKTVRVKQRGWWKTADVTLAYSQHHLADSEAVTGFEEWIKNLMARGRLVPKEATRC